MHNTTLIPLFLLCCPPLLAQALNTEVQADLRVDVTGLVYTVVASAENKTELNKSLAYNFKLLRTDSIAAASREAPMEGLFVLQPLERKTLLEESFEIPEGQRAILLLLLREEEQVVATKRVIINELEGEDQVAPLVRTEEELVGGSYEANLMRGMVIEDTKTKPGRDFYRMFYNAYNQRQINGEKIVTVREELAIGNNTQIRILAEQEVIFEFFVNPRSDYMRQAAEVAVTRTAQYFERLKKIKNQQIRY